MSTYWSIGIKSSQHLDCPCLVCKLFCCCTACFENAVQSFQTNKNIRGAGALWLMGIVPAQQAQRRVSTSPNTVTITTLWSILNQFLMNQHVIRHAWTVKQNEPCFQVKTHAEHKVLKYLQRRKDLTWSKSDCIIPQRTKAALNPMNWIKPTIYILGKKALKSFWV